MEREKLSGERFKTEKNERLGKNQKNYLKYGYGYKLNFRAIKKKTAENH